MQYLVTAKEMKQYDQNTIEQIGIPGLVLMERAALAACEEILRLGAERKPGEQTAFILAGVGNNGADGLALARMLSEAGFRVCVQIVGDESKATDQWRTQRRILAHYPVEIGGKASKREYTVNIDALFGVGLSREVRGEYREAIEAFEQRKGWKVSLDMPSGLDADVGKVYGCAARADCTVTFGFCKRGLVLGEGRKYAGRVVIADIGISERSMLGIKPDMFYYDEAVVGLMPYRDPAGNKGTFGKVLLIAGSYDMAGAAILAAKAAYRTGAGMVKVITPTCNRAILQQAVPEALLGEPDSLGESLLWADVVAIGPGIGKGVEALEALRRILRESKLPLVLDADALNLLAQDELLLRELSGQNRQAVLTPHVGELSGLTGKSIAELKENLSGNAMEFARNVQKTVLAKDAVSFICKEGEPICANLRGTNGMATAGSGDVLAGVVAGLLAQGMTDYQSACVGAYLHACAGEIASAKNGTYGCMAGDIAEALAEVTGAGLKS